MKNWKRSSLFAVLLICVGTLMMGCGTKLSDKFDEDKVKEAAQTMVTRVNTEELEGVYNDTFAPVMQQGIALDTLQKNLDGVLNKLGEFENFEKIEVAGTEDKDTGTPYAMVIVLAKYAEGKAQYTITFDTDLKCAGFYIK